MGSTIVQKPAVSGAGQPALERQAILRAVEDELAAARFIDVHTHLFMPSLGQLGLWGIDELITYHYLEAELFRSSNLKPEQYGNMSKREKADAIWRALFVENAPVSEATRGVVSVLNAFGLPTSGSDLTKAREFFAAQKLDAHIRRVFELAGVSEVVMTNDPLDPDEAPLWEQGARPDSQFHPVLRLDRILNKWPNHCRVLAAQGYAVNDSATEQSVMEVRRFLAAWFKRMQPVYMAVSLPDTFQFPEDSVRARLLTEAVIPACREFGVPLSLMIGVRYQVNPRLRLAGDGAGKADLRAVERLCTAFPDNRFLISVLSRENQHELCVYARKFSNLMPFGCWWFLNNPSVVEEITRERLEMLGTSFIPQHSDARVLEQVIYKWRNTRRTLAPILANSYRLLAEDGRPVTRGDIQHDINRLFRSNFEDFVGLRGANGRVGAA
ncbi:MAG TPA: glucuronate isomerase [Bryobacteraceae bacterium]|nr:glucuronate isomerase [Bryobacteraceae bacterium]